MTYQHYLARKQIANLEDLNKERSEKIEELCITAI